MSMLTLIGGAIKGLKIVGAGLAKVGATIMKIAPTVGKVVSTGAVTLGANTATAAAAGKVAEIATAYVISKGVDKLTDATIEKVPSWEWTGFTLDVATDIAMLKGVWK